jgi:hypothetical protein
MNRILKAKAAQSAWPWPGNHNSIGSPVGSRRSKRGARNLSDQSGRRDLIPRPPVTVGMSGAVWLRLP